MRRISFLLDRSTFVPSDNLRDICRRYVDVTDLAFCIDYLERWGKRNAA